MSRLPIDALLPSLVDTLKSSGAAIVEAEPGAGKTTRVPLELLERGVAGDKQILVLEPRRLAARLPAIYVASLLHEPIGERVGYQVRFDDRTGPKTRLRFITDALLLRFLVADPTLKDVGVIVFDEFHERRLSAELALGLVQALRASERPDLKVVVMSATLDVEPIARYLGGSPVLKASGRQHEVSVSYLERSDERPLAQQVQSAVRRALALEGSGDMLVFLPGAGEIRRAEEGLSSLAREHDLFVVPLHGELPPEAQDRALRPNPRRKVILSTNVAETSVTIDGVTVVIDSGVARIAGHSPWSGLPSLRVRPVSRASAIQRAGRAGRTAKGHALRLYTRHEFETRPAFEVPEIRRADLAETVLTLAVLGVHEPARFAWLDAPSKESLAAAQGLLRRLGALDESGAPTRLGEELARLPLHPRLGRLVVEAARRGAASEGALAAAILSERDLRLDRNPAREDAPSDVVALIDLFRAAAGERFAEGALRRLSVHMGAARAVDRAREQILSMLGRRGERASDPEIALRFALLAAYPDRVAARASGNEVLLSGGGRARLAEQSVVRSASYLVAIDAEEGGGGGAQRLPLVRIASAIEADWLLELGDAALEDVAGVSWNEASERVEEVSRLSYGALVLSESMSRDVDSEKAAKLLATKALAAGLRAFVDIEAFDALAARVEFLRAALGADRLPAFDATGLGAILERACVGCTSFADLREADLLAQIRANLGQDASSLLARSAPESVLLPGGRRTPVHYEPGKPPWIESYLQDFFGMADGPRVAEGRVPLTLHLLAPNRRAVQVTSDLKSFWARHYPELVRALSRRYPKHSWPADPLHAAPPPPRRR